MNAVPIVRAQNVKMGRFIENKNEAITKELSEQLPRSALYKDCLLMTFIGAGVGETCIFHANKRNHLAPNVAKIEPFDEHINMEYALSFFMSSLGQLGVTNISKSTAQASLSMATIRELVIPIPPIKEQSRIANEVAKWFSLIECIEENKGNLQETIKQTKSKILDLAIHGKLVPQDPNDEPATELLKRINPKAEITCDNPQYGNLPKGWCICRLKDMAKVITGSTPSKSNKEYYGGNFPFYKPADLDLGRHVNKASEYLTQAGKNVSRLVPSGTTAVCCIGSIGKVGFLEYEGTTNQQINCVIPSECLDNVYLYYSCSSQWFYSSLIAESSAVTISIVNKSKMENVVMPLPPLQEQHRIVAKIEELFTQLDKIEASL